MSRKYQAISLGNLVMQKCPDKITKDFEANKSLVNKVLFYDSPSQLKSEYLGILEGSYDAKRLRNEIAGYLTNEYRKMREHEQNPSGYDPHGSHAAPKKKQKIGRYFRKHR
jgi:ribosomal protein S17E